MTMVQEKAVDFKSIEKEIYVTVKQKWSTFGKQNSPTFS